MKKKVLSKVAFWSIVMMVLVLLAIPTETLNAGDGYPEPPKGPTEHHEFTIICYNTSDYNCATFPGSGERQKFIIVCNQNSND